MNHKHRGLYFSHPACLEHDPREWIPGHPDTPRRLLAIETELDARGWLGWERRPAPAADETQLELVHGARHVRAIAQLCAEGGGVIDPDTAVGRDSWGAALHAAGGACAMTSTLLAGEAAVAFSAGRPSGHHAEPQRAMGFCLFDNVAIAAELAIAEHGCERVFVLDWDVHHGNGTEAAFRARRDVLFASIHQGGIYPGTGALTDAGAGAGEGYTINLPVPGGSQEGLWLSLLELVLRAADSFAPELVLVSAGFDAHVDDPLAGCLLRTESFAQLACRVREFAAERALPLGVVLEGGYEPLALARSVAATLAALGGDGEGRALIPDLSPAVEPLLGRSLAQVGRYWTV